MVARCTVCPDRTVVPEANTRSVRPDGLAVSLFPLSPVLDRFGPNIRYSSVLLIATCLCTFAKGLAAEETGSAPARWYDRAYQRLETTWREGKPELYLPLHTTHLRFAYSREKIESYNEDPRGIGMGKGMYDADGDWHGLYFVGFKDSNSKPEYAAGYGYRTFWNPAGDLKLGLGYNAFITARSDIGHYAPIPLLLPVVSLGYKKFTLDTTYVPGWSGKENVLFFLGRIAF